MHPIEIAEYFKTGGIDILKSMTEDLIKFFMFGDFVKVKAELKNTSLLTIVQEELKQYPYARKKVNKVRT